MTNYFENAKTVEELKATYKELVKKYHPDIYGEKGNEILKDVHSQLEKATKKIDKGYYKQFDNTDIKEESEEIRAKKEELAKEAIRYKNPEFYLFAMYWNERLTPSNHRNPLSKHNFSGWNIWSLELQMLLQGYKSSEWSTFAQLKNAKQPIKKGEHGTYITLAIIVKSKKENDDEEQKEKVYYKGYTVFNAEQTKEYKQKEKQAPAITEVKQITTAKQTEKAEQKVLDLWQTFEVVA